MNERWWEAARRRAVRRAFRTVPLYREQWAVAGRPLEEPSPVPLEGLGPQLYRLCPLGRVWSPAREPPLWTGRPQGLWRALRDAGALDRRVPVLEVRPALVDWRSLSPVGPRYAAVLAPDADTGGPGSEPPDAPALELARRAGGAVLVGSPDEAAAVHGRLAGAMVGDVRVVHRLAPAEGVVAESGPLVVAVPLLGYVGALVPRCGAVHVDWRRWHVLAVGGGLSMTALAQRRPALVSVLVPTAAPVAVGRCPRHGVPTLAPPP